MGNGPVDALKNALFNTIGVDISILDYSEHGLEEGSNAKAAAYILLKDNKAGTQSFGVGVSTNITRASVRAVFSALNRISK